MERKEQLDELLNASWGAYFRDYEASGFGELDQDVEVDLDHSLSDQEAFNINGPEFDEEFAEHLSSALLVEMIRAKIRFYVDEKLDLEDRISIDSFASALCELAKPMFTEKQQLEFERRAQVIKDLKLNFKELLDFKEDKSRDLDGLLRKLEVVSTRELMYLNGVKGLNDVDENGVYYRGFAGVDEISADIDSRMRKCEWELISLMFEYLGEKEKGKIMSRSKKFQVLAGGSSMVMTVFAIWYPFFNAIYNDIDSMSNFSGWMHLVSLGIALFLLILLGVENAKSKNFASSFPKFKASQLNAEVLGTAGNFRAFVKGVVEFRENEEWDLEDIDKLIRGIKRRLNNCKKVGSRPSDFVLPDFTVDKELPEIEEGSNEDVLSGVDKPEFVTQN